MRKNASGREEQVKLLNRIFNTFRISKFKSRLRFLFICFIILLVFLFSIPFFLVGKQHKKEDANVAIEKTINLQKIVINNWFEERKAGIRFLSELPSVKNLDLSKMKDVLEIFDTNNPEFNGIVYVNENGITEIDTTGPIGIDISDRNYFKEAKNGNSFITDILVGRESHTQVIIFSHPVFDNNNRFNGLVFGSVPLQTITNVMDQFQDGKRETYLVNRNGMLISESRQGKIGEFINSEIYREALTGDKLTKFYKTHNGEKVLGDYRWVHNDQWLIIGEIAEKKIYESFYQMAMMFSIVILTLTLLGYLVIIRMADQVSAPLHKVLVGTRKLGEGHFKYRLKKNQFKQDAIEFQELCDNFNHMSRLIEKYIDSMVESEGRFRMIAENSSDMITIHDTLGNYLYVSPAGKEILQYEDEEVIGRDAYSFIHPDDRDMITKNHQILLDRGSVVSTYRIRRKDGEYLWIEASLKCLQVKNTEDPKLIAIARNITDRKIAEHNLKEDNRILHELSTKDALTGIWNRRTFDERIEIEWNNALRNSTSLSIIMLDIDYFKSYNDIFGHQEGDDCLKEVASVIKETLKRSRDIIFRYGGEEFIVILPHTDREGAERVAENIRKAVIHLKIPHSGSEVNKYVTTSLGINTVVPTVNHTIKEFIEGADKALYRAKKAGRNGFESSITT